MKTAAKQIAVCALLLLAFCALARLIHGSSYMVYEPLPRHGFVPDLSEGLKISEEEPNIAHVEHYEIRDDVLTMTISPEREGSTYLTVQDLEGEMIALIPVKVGRFLTVLDRRTNGFTCDVAVMAAVTVFWLLTACIMLVHFRLAKGELFYRYSTIYFSGFFLFSGFAFLLMFSVTVRHILFPADYTMYSVISAMNSAAKQFMMTTTPLLLVFSGAMILSNLALMHHEGRRIQNALGILVSILMISGMALGWFLFMRNFFGSEWEARVQNALENVYATAFVYFECMLAGSVICALRASRYRPEWNQDYIVILGCWFRKDGTLPPLLKGRVDRAADFWKDQKAVCGKEAVLIPSGGQGRDECMPEAEAMRRYLIAQGIPDDRIVPETQSGSTLENMKFSKAVIDSFHQEGNTLFVTTSYHVFRSGVLSGQAGLPAVGIGSRTKWWFWPNAFMRECAGLLLKRWKQELLMLVFLMAVYGLLSLAL